MDFAVVHILFQHIVSTTNTDNKNPFRWSCVYRLNRLFSNFYCHIAHFRTEFTFSIMIYVRYTTGSCLGLPHLLHTHRRKRLYAVTHDPLKPSIRVTLQVSQVRMTVVSSIPKPAALNTICHFLLSQNEETQLAKVQFKLIRYCIARLHKG
jgi:hypothetical protein